MTDVPLRTEMLMGTLVTIHVVPPGADLAVERAFGWFREIERRCTRFDEGSELMQLSTHVGVPVPASAMLCEAVRFALAVAADTGGAFDPTVGHAMEVARLRPRASEPGVRSEPRSERRRASPTATSRSMSIDERSGCDGRSCSTLGLWRKGMAIDMAAAELRELGNFAIDAGGDLYRCVARILSW